MYIFTSSFVKKKKHFFNVECKCYRANISEILKGLKLKHLGVTKHEWDVGQLFECLSWGNFLVGLKGRNFSWLARARDEERQVCSSEDPPCPNQGLLLTTPN
jgi:hypothetical protein